MECRAEIERLRAGMAKAIIGQEQVIERLLIGLLANGNLLLEGLPGLAKTRAIKALADNMDTDFSRIQFTPDLLPSDVTGNEVYYSKDGAGEFRFEAGPIFANIVLSDEINRAPAKVQAALLEAMEERQVTVAGTTHKLPKLFMVMATQNPIEQEGTYPLPEAQMDRFLMHVRIDYPLPKEELKIVSLVRDEEIAANKPQNSKNAKQDKPVSQDAVFEARDEIAAVHVSDTIAQYIVDLVFATRFPENYSTELAKWIDVGASPRASIALDKCSRVHAWLNDRDYVDMDDVRAVVADVLRHRISLTYDAEGDGLQRDEVIAEIIKNVAVS